MSHSGELLRWLALWTGPEEACRLPDASSTNPGRHLRDGSLWASDGHDHLQGESGVWQEGQLRRRWRRVSACRHHLKPAPRRKTGCCLLLHP